MAVENIMYFALGLLLAGLFALMIMPAIWRRAVRLTRKRIEAATPMSLAEFRAEKDQLRAEFALSTRRLESIVDGLRKRVAEQLQEIGSNKADMAALRADRDNHLTIVREFEEREGELRRRVLELEKETAELGTRLRTRERELADRDAELETLRGPKRGLTAPRVAQAKQAEPPPSVPSLESEPAPVSDATAEMLRAALAKPMQDDGPVGQELREAEAQLAQAEDRVKQLLTETQQVGSEAEPVPDRSLADRLSLDDELETLRTRIQEIELAVMADTNPERLDQSELRSKLNDIAHHVARLVYTVDGADGGEEESLFDRVQRFAADGTSVEALPAQSSLNVEPTPPSQESGPVADRLSALRHLRGT